MPTDSSRSGGVSRLLSRPMRGDDIAECLAQMPAHLGLDDATRARLPALWRQLVNEPSVISGVQEDLSRPAGQRIQFWGVTMVLPPALVQRLALETAPSAYVTRRIYAAFLDQGVAPLADREIGVLNARGETVLMVMHAAIPGFDPDDPATHHLLAIAQDTFRRFHDGYQLRAVYYENHAQAAPLAMHSGFNELRLADHGAVQHLSAEQRPALYGLTREEARRRLPGTPVRSVFEHQPPRFRFNASQRRLLWQALFDDDEEHLVAVLDTSVHGLKKLWRGIYERIEDVAPGFFGDAAAGADEARRGREKRRQVLAYVRHRAEELRPWTA